MTTPTSESKTTPPARGRESLSPAVQAQIGQGLKAVFDDVAREPIPDDLLRLLEELETRDRKKNTK